MFRSGAAPQRPQSSVGTAARMTAMTQAKFAGRPNSVEHTDLKSNNSGHTRRRRAVPD